VSNGKINVLKEDSPIKERRSIAERPTSRLQAPRYYYEFQDYLISYRCWRGVCTFIFAA